MLNIPGTLLFVRKINFTKNKRVPSYIIMSDVTTHKRYAIPYGDSVLLLELKDFDPKRKSSKYIKVLYKKNVLYTILTKNQINRIFSLENAWKNFGHDIALEGYKENGLMNHLYNICDMLNR
jgi:hypothetical protein